MRRPALRYALLLVLAGGLAVAAYQLATLEAERRAAGAAIAAFDASVDDGVAEVASLRATQQAYVAAGQGVEYRVEQATTLLARLGSRLVDLKQQASSQESATAIGVAAQAIDSFAELDERVREYAANGQVLMASDIIFTDGHELLARADAGLDDARQAEHRDAEIASDVAARRQAVIALSAGAAGLLVAALLAIPAGGRTGRGADTVRDGSRQARSDVDLDSTGPKSPGDDGAESGTASPAGDTDRTSLERLPVPASSSAAVAAGGSAPATPESPDSIDETIGGVATLCVDLARMTDARDLPALVGRSAKLLDASGVIVWLTAPGGTRLLPALTHGYSADVVSRMGAIARDDDNATAAAFRLGRMLTVEARAGANGAIVAPLISGDACTGAVAIEVPAGAERDATRRHVATILAAQLGTLVSEAPASSSQGDDARAEA